LSFKAAAVEAIAVPQIPTKWTDLIFENIDYIIEAVVDLKREKRPAFSHKTQTIGQGRNLN
jgi:hypothetical protein